MEEPAEVWSALRGNPLRFLVSSWPRRSLAYLATSALAGLVVLVGFFVLVGVGVVTTVIVVGFFVLGAVPGIAGRFAGLERRRLRMMRIRIPRAEDERPSARELGYTVLLALVFWLLDAVVAFNAVLLPGVLILSPVLAAFDRVDVFAWRVESPAEALPLALVGGPVAFALASYAVTLVAAAQASLARILLSPSEQVLAERIRVLGESRARLVGAFETERRRIERDLHDGVQQRLVALTMTLGSAELDAEGPALELVRRAHLEAEEALAELRSTVRGIHPRVLVDHGLAAAVHEVSDRSPVPVHVDVEVDRLPGAVEAAAYFVVSEALTNVARHAGARQAWVRGWVHEGRLILTVTDDGSGGAVVRPGSGLDGLGTRLEALDGTLLVTSPPGGPTEIRMECPCRIES